MLGGGRRVIDCGEVESYVDWLKRVTVKVLATARNSGADSWVTSYRRRKYRFAGKVACCGDDRWSHKLLFWEPISSRGRRVGRPTARWDDDFTYLMGGNWQRVARDTSLWQLLEDEFVTRQSTL